MRNENIKLTQFQKMFDYLSKKKPAKIIMWKLRATYIFNWKYFREYMAEFLKWGSKKGLKLSVEKGDRNQRFLVVK